MDVGSNKSRKDTRAVVSLVARYRSPSTFEYVQEACCDVSVGGMFIKSTDPAAAGTLLKLECEADNATEKIRGVARVVWLRRDANEYGPSGMGVKFVKLEPGSRETITRIVQELSAAGIEPQSISSAPESRGKPPGVHAASARAKAAAAPAAVPASPAPRPAEPAPRSAEPAPAAESAPVSPVATRSPRPTPLAGAAASALLSMAERQSFPAEVPRAAVTPPPGGSLDTRPQRDSHIKPELVDGAPSTAIDTRASGAPAARPMEPAATGTRGGLRLRWLVAIGLAALLIYLVSKKDTSGKEAMPSGASPAVTADDRREGAPSSPSQQDRPATHAPTALLAENDPRRAGQAAAEGAENEPAAANPQGTDTQAAQGSDPGSGAKATGPAEPATSATGSQPSAAPTQPSAAQTTAAQAPSSAQGAQPPAAQAPGAQAAQGPAAQAAQGPGAQAAQGPGAQAAQGPGALAAQGLGTQVQAAQGPGMRAPQGPGTQVQAPGTQAQAAQGPAAQVAQAPGAQAAQGPGAQVAQGPGAQAAQGPGAQAAQGPGAQVAQGPGAQTAQGPGAQAAQAPRAQAPAAQPSAATSAAAQTPPPSAAATGAAPARPPLPPGELPYIMSFVTRPPGATVTIGSQTIVAPGEIDLGAMPPRVRVTAQKEGHESSSVWLDRHTEFEKVGNTMRRRVYLTLPALKPGSEAPKR